MNGTDNSLVQRGPATGVLTDKRYEADPGSSLRGFFRFGLYLPMTFSLAMIQAGLLPTRHRVTRTLPRFYHRMTCHIMGMEVVVRGRQSPARPTLFASNHTSYLDIPVLGGLIEGSFVAKTEVAGWPVFGFLSKLQNTVFVDRQRKTVGRQRDDLQRRLDAGDNLVLFPEGTSNDGNRVLPFRSALFGVAERESAGRPLIVQPVSIAYVALNDIPIGHGYRPLVAWYGDMSLGPHLWAFSRLGRVRIVVEFHDPVTIADFPSRKELARHCHATVAQGVALAIGGRG
jgi:lyso-ornithine lipid O-acyltransferase